MNVQTMFVNKMTHKIKMSNIFMRFKGRKHKNQILQSIKERIKSPGHQADSEIVFLHIWVVCHPICRVNDAGVCVCATICCCNKCQVKSVKIVSHHFHLHPHSPHLLCVNLFLDFPSFASHTWEEYVNVGRRPLGFPYGLSHPAYPGLNAITVC